MRDNPHSHYYAGVYALSMGTILLLKAVRGIVFVKVSFPSEATPGLTIIEY